MQLVLLKDVKKGTYFSLKDSETAPIWIRGDYDRSLKKYECYKYDNVCHTKFMKSTQKIFI